MTREMSVHLHRASVPVFSRYLDRLLALLDIAEAQGAQRPLQTPPLLSARLAPDMLDFHAQVEIAANFSLRTCFPLAGRPVPDYGTFPRSADGLRERLRRARRLIQDLEPPAFESTPARRIRDRAGDAVIELPAEEYLLHFALPNFIFHVSMAYAILRRHGVPVGKQDFDGMHVYVPPRR
jgi:hypothetical protein